MPLLVSGLGPQTQRFHAGSTGGGRFGKDLTDDSTARQQGRHGRRADLYTDYTFAVWDGDKLVPFAKAYSGLTDAEINKVDYFIKRNTLEKFGPVRTVKPELVFEIGFEDRRQCSPPPSTGRCTRPLYTA